MTGFTFRLTFFRFFVIMHLMFYGGGKMKLFETLVGNAKIKNTLAADIEKGTQSHAYIIEGAEGSGKHTAVTLAVMSLFCKRNGDSLPCRSCPSCKKVFEGIAPDVTVIKRQNTATLGVESVRIVKETLRLAPVEEKYKVYIVEEADKMTKAAQNALLLSLEEPPEYVAFFLLCTDASLLLETIRSRAPVIKTEVFDSSFISSYLLNDSKYRNIRDTDRMRFDEAVTAAEGSAGKAKKLLDSESSSQVHEWLGSVKAVVSALCRSSIAERIKTSELFPKDRTELCEFLKDVSKGLRDVLKYKKCPGATDGYLIFTDIEELKTVSRPVRTERVVRLSFEVCDMAARIASNANPTSLILLLLTKQ